MSPCGCLWDYLDVNHVKYGGNQLYGWMPWVYVKEYDFGIEC